MANNQQARDDHGRFAGNNHVQEQAARQNDRFPVIAHDGARSVASHTGTYRGLGASSPAQQRKYERRTK